MNKRRIALVAFLLAASSGASCSNNRDNRAAVIVASSLPRVGGVDDCFQSYNVEMLEVTGGRFWKPYRDVDVLLRDRPGGIESRGEPAATPSGMDANLYQYRRPVDLSNPRLRKLAAALGPAYVRVSGTWANATYFHDSSQPAPKTPPNGFGGVLTREQWDGVLDFARSVDAKLVTSFATSVGTRDATGAWKTDEARKLLGYTTSRGGSIAAAEYMNEPTYAEMGGAPKGYDAAAFGRDVQAFVRFVKQASPETIILGPGGVGEGIPLAPIGLAGSLLKSEDLLAASGPVFDAFSYHSYGATSKRCASMGPASQTTVEAALSDELFSRADRIERFYASLRDRFEPGKALWLTETADAACGGNPWATTFLDSFRYLDQMALLAKRGVQTHMHNTLAASDYGLLDENSFLPRPNYWAALLWRKLMGSIVLDVGASPTPSLRLYAHCLRGQTGGVVLLVINTDRANSHSFDLPVVAERYTLSAPQLESTAVLLNGSELKLGEGDSLPALLGSRVPAGPVAFEPATITFIALPNANNGSCR
jgi:heparanase 1